jgi:hypothetical protein
MVRSAALSLTDESQMRASIKHRRNIENPIVDGAARRTLALGVQWAERPLFA